MIPSYDRTLTGSRGKGGDVGFPGSSGLRPSDARAMKNRPLPGSSPHRTARSPIGRGGRRSGSTPEGCLFRSPGVEARSADDPGSPAIRLIYATPCGSLLQRSPLRPTPGGVEGGRGDVGYPGSSGLCPSDTRAMKNRPLPGSSPDRTAWGRVEKIGYIYPPGACGMDHRMVVEIYYE